MAAVSAQTPIPQAEMDRLETLASAEAAIAMGADPDGKLDPLLTCSADFTESFGLGDLGFTMGSTWRVDEAYVGYGMGMDAENLAGLKEMILASETPPEVAEMLDATTLEDFHFALMGYEAFQRITVYEKANGTMGESPLDIEVCFDDSMENIEAGLNELEEFEKAQGTPMEQEVEADMENGPMADPALQTMLSMLENPSITVDGNHETISYGPMGTLGTIDIYFMNSGVLKEVEASCPTTGAKFSLKVANFETPAPMPDTSAFKEGGGCGDLDTLTMEKVVAMVKASGRRLTDQDSLKDQMTLQTANALRHAHKMMHSYKDAKESAAFWDMVRRSVEVLVLLVLAVVFVRGMQRYLGKDNRIADEDDSSRLLDDESPYAVSYEENVVE